MFGDSKATNPRSAQSSYEYQGNMNQQTGSFQQHLPTKQEGQNIAYQSFKKTVPMMDNQNGIESMQISHDFNVFHNYALDGQPQVNEYAFPPEASNPQQYQQELTQGEMDPYSMVSSSGGLLYFNQKETLSTQKVPCSIKLEGESHTWLLVLNLVLLIGIIAAFIAMKFLSFQIWMLGPIIAVPYLVYILVGLMMNNSMLALFNDVKDCGQIEKSFELVKVSQGDITFLVYCYHNAPGRHIRRVTTHTAKGSFALVNCVDQSEDFSMLKEKHAFLIGTASTCFYFGDSQSQNKFLAAFKEFRDANRKDRSQNYTHGVSIMTPNLGQPFTISTRGSACYVKPLYYLFFFLGLGYPYTMFIECRIGRYRLNCVKRLTAA